MFGWLKKIINPTSGPDFSGVDSREKAEELCTRGELVKLLLTPVEFGGQDVPSNVVYVPLVVAQLKQSTDASIVPTIMEQRKTKRYAAEPQYDGASVVPCAIKIVLSDPGEFPVLIRIWGKALTT